MVTNIMSVHRPSGDERLVFIDTNLPEPTCANSRYRSRLDHFLVTKSSTSLQGTVIRSNRGGTSTATKNKRKTKRYTGFTLQHPALLKIFSFTIPLTTLTLFK